MGWGDIEGFCHKIFLICKNYFPGSKLPTFSHSAWYTSCDDWYLAALLDKWFAARINQHKTGGLELLTDNKCFYML